MAPDSFQPAKLPYRYEFDPAEAEAIAACNRQHGFAVVRGVLTPGQVEQFRESVWRVLDPERTLKPGETRVQTDFIEHAPPLWDLLAHEDFLRLNRTILGADDLTVHRSAAILKNAGAGPVVWHTDWHGYGPLPARTPNEILNRGEWPNGMWFYLNGTHPERAGLAVIADSHPIAWTGPEGFAFTPERRSFHRPGTEPKSYDQFDVPGVVPLFTEPGDLIIFDTRTYHAAFPHGGSEARLSCGFIFRPTSPPFRAPWERTESARRFCAALPFQLQPFVREYTGLDPAWKLAEGK